MSLRKKLIRLAYQKPEIRKEVLPILKVSSLFGALSLLNGRYAKSRGISIGRNPVTQISPKEALELVNAGFATKFEFPEGDFLRITTKGRDYLEMLEDELF